MAGAISGNVALAIQKAQLAVQCDNEEHYVEAILGYAEAVHLIQHELPQAPTEQQPILERYLTTYQARVDLLQDQVGPVTIPVFAKPSQNAPVLASPNTQSPATSGQARQLSTLTIPEPSSTDVPNFYGRGGIILYPTPFEEIPVPPTAQRPDNAPAFGNPHHPYWLMASLRKTMVSGGYLTPSIYVPRELWHQTGVKLAALKEKTAVFEGVADRLFTLQELHKQDSSTALLQGELTDFVAHLGNCQHQLSKALSFIPDSKKKESTATSGIGKFGDRMRLLGSNLANKASRLAIGSTRTEDLTYIQLVLTVLENSAFLEHWLTHYESVGPSAREIIDRLEAISSWFNTVLCPILMRDFKALLERYMKISREGFTRVTDK